MLWCGILMLSRELTNPVFTNVTLGVSPTYNHWRKTPQYLLPVFPLRLGKCEITQTGLGKCEFAQNCKQLAQMSLMNLPQITRTLPKRRQKFAQILHKFFLLQLSKLTTKTILLLPRFRAISKKMSSLANGSLFVARIDSHIPVYAPFSPLTSITRSGVRPGTEQLPNSIRDLPKL